MNLAGKSAQGYQNMSIHPYIHLLLPIQGQVLAVAALGRCLRPPSHQQHLPAPQKALPGQSVCVFPPASPGARRAQDTSTWRRPLGILIRCQNYLNWLLSTPRSSSSTLSSFRMAELLTLSLRVRPITLWRKLISAACTCDHALSVDMQSS